MDHLFELHSIGCNRVETPVFVIDRPNGSNDFLFLHFTSKAEIEIDSHRFIIEPGGCILYAPGFRQWYGSMHCAFSNSYIHFDNLGMNLLIGQFGIPLNRVFYPKQDNFIENILSEIESEFLLKDLFWEESITGLIKHFLARMGRSLAIVRSHKEKAEMIKFYEQFRRARLIIIRSLEKNWNLTEMAKLMNLCPSRFCIYYKQFFNISPRSELIQARIDRAKYLLTNQAHSVQEIAALTGYFNASHFIRQFKTAVGISPGKYRAMSFIYRQNR